MVNEGTIEESRLRSEQQVLEDKDEQKFEDGFTIKTVIGALFIAFIMLPGAMYLGLVAGGTMGPAAQWVTIVLFAEVARRSFIPLKRQEIYILFYVAGGLSSVVLADKGISGGPFGYLIWNQYLVQSPLQQDIVKNIPRWVAPATGSESLIARTFLHHDWLMPIGLLVMGEILGRFMWIGGGYALFRLTSDVERLPFPMAPIAAAGATALAEAGSKEESWRWNVFSTGAMIGIIYGFLYLFIPIFTGMFLSEPVELIPIMFFDLMPNTERILPAALTGISTDLGSLMIGFVLPFPILLGQFISSVICQIGINPILYHSGYLPKWRYGMGTIPTQIATQLDFWMSVGVGIGLAVAVIGLVTVFRTAAKMRRDSQHPTIRRTLPQGRGDWPLWLSIGAWLFATICYIVVSGWMLDWHRGMMFWIIFFGIIWTPVNSYVSARMIGLTGQGVGFPFIKEATIIKSGYKDMKIWFTPLPLHDLGIHAQRFREVELTGTKFTSVIKAEILMFLVLIPASFLFWSFFWHTSPIPSPQYPFAQRFWPQRATMESIWWTANRSGADNFLFEALKPKVIVGAGAAAFITYGICTLFKLPLMFFYGLAFGVGALPHSTIPALAGALLGRYYFAKRFGTTKWSLYAPVLLAGFSCGMGLCAMLGISLALISKSVSYLPF